MMNVKIDLLVLQNVSRTVGDPLVKKDAKSRWNVAPIIGVLGCVVKTVLKSAKDVTEMN